MMVVVVVERGADDMFVQHKPTFTETMNRRGTEKQKRSG